MLKIRTWCLPAELTEEEMNNLHNAIVNAVISIPETGVSSENDMLNLFPADMMKYGLGTEIFVEILQCELEEEGCALLTEAVGKTVKGIFPKANVECIALKGNVSAQWSSEKEKQNVHSSFCGWHNFHPFS